MKAEILKIAGVKTEKEFYSKFPTEEAFMAKHGGQFKKAQQGTNVLPIDITQQSDSLSPVFNTKKIVNYQPGVSNSKMGNGFYLYSRNQSDPGFNPDRDREFVKQAEMEAVQRTPQWRDYMQTKKPINNSLVSMEQGGEVLKNYKFDFPTAQFGTLQGPSNQTGDWYQDNNPYMATTPGPTGANNPSVANNPSAPQGDSGMGSNMMGAFTQVFNGFKALGAQKKALKEARAWGAATALQAKAAESIDVDSLKPRKFVRPEDQLIQPNQMFPSNGVGTNILNRNGGNIDKAKQGTKLKKLNNPEIVYDDAEYISIAQNGGGYSNFMNQQGGNQVGSALASNYYENNAGSQIGGGIGKAFGVGFFGEAIGGALDTTARKLKDQQKQTQKNIDRVQYSQYAKGIQGQYNGYMEDGGQVLNDYNLGGEVDTLWGGGAETISENPHMPGTGETIMFRGQSHDDGGIGITYGDNPVEVEGGEPAVVLPNAQGEENLTVFGNLNIPDQFVPILGDDKAKGMKFKNYISQLSKKEEKHNNSLQKSTQEIDTLDMTTPYDKLKFSTLQANILGQNMSLKEIADKKQKASELQAMLNDTAEQHGLSAEHLAKGKIKQAKNGMDIAQAGKTISSNQINDYINKGYKQDPNDPLRLYKPGSASITIKGSPEKQSSSTSVKRNTSSTVHRATRGGGAPNAKWYSWVKQQLNNGVSYEELASKGHGTLQGLKQKFPNEYKATTDNLEVINNQEYTPATKDVSTQSSPGDEVFVKPQNNYETVPYKRSGLIDAYNMILPFIRPTNQEGLHPGQLAGEMYALSSNKVEPVQAQTYQPDLTSPIDVSHQEQMNEIIAQTRAAQRMSQNNPEAQAFIASNAYEAINKVKGKELRDNQEMRFNTFNQNRNTLNDAKLKNLGIFDQQYVRQEQAKSNTKAIAQSALNSMADKYAKNKLENRTLGIQENMYNYRFDKQGRAINFNPLFQANEQSIYSPNANEPITQVPVLDANGKIVSFQQVGGNSNNVGTQTPIQDFDQPIYYKPIQPGEGVDTSVGTYKNGGKVSKKKYTNGSIVSSMKRC